MWFEQEGVCVTAGSSCCGCFGGGVLCGWWRLPLFCPAGPAADRLLLPMQRAEVRWGRTLKSVVLSRAVVSRGTQRCTG